MIYEIKNDYLTVKINSVGAEIISVLDNKTKIEYIWQGDSKYWTGHSPVLFPQCGRIYQEKYLYNGQEFRMPKHGFARHSEFNLKQINNNSIELYINDSKETKDIYPFKFQFTVGYKLDKNKLVFSFHLLNKGENTLYFSYGGHPAFNCPIGKIGKFDDYYLEFSKNQYIQRTFTENGLYPNVDVKWNLKDNKLNLKHDLFDNDAIFFVNDKDTIYLKNNLNNNYIKISFDNMKAVGFWHTNKSDAPFICIEPQFGFPGEEGIIGEIRDKLDESKLGINEEHFNSYSVEFFSE